MKYALILCCVGTFFISACQQEATPIITTLEIQANRVLPPNELNRLKEELKARLSNFPIENIKIKDHVKNNQIIVKTDAKVEDIDFYNSLFEAYRLDLWNTLRITDTIIMNIRPSKLEVEDFVPFTELEQGFYPKEVIGICKEESQLAKITTLLSDSLQDIENLKLIWSLEKGGGLEKTDYMLYMIDTEGQQQAALTEKAITTAAVRPDNYSSSYAIDFVFNEAATKKWANMTERAEKNNNRSIAIILNDRLLTCPRVMAAIPSGNCTINGNFTEKQAYHLVKHFSISRLSYSFKIIEQVIENKPSQ